VPVFERVTVDYLTAGGAHVVWYTRWDFTEAQPHTYQLQVNLNGGDPDEWEDVGTTVVNGNEAYDDEKRLYGKRRDLVYRVKLTTTVDTYYSEVAEVLGRWSKRQWLTAQAVIRRALLDPSGLESFPGRMLKRKIHGTVCTCVDPYTGAITNSNCTTCNGTGRLEGYWAGANRRMFDRTPLAEQTVQQDGRGTVDDTMIATGLFVGIPTIQRRDIWVDDASDKRYFVEAVKHKAELAGVPLVTSAELRLVPASHAVYAISVEIGS
jgi:hypothetical protein